MIYYQGRKKHVCGGFEGAKASDKPVSKQKQKHAEVQNQMEEKT